MTILLYACTIFLSAFLLFAVQPMIAKIILPWFGGAAGVWITCMLFFQTTLVLGYLYAHVLIRRLNQRRQSWLHAALLACSLAALPVLPGENWKPSGPGEPAWQILILLAACVGLPYFLLSTTGPLIQAWYARTHPEGMPYRLYALSNLGSLAALLAYPLIVEPLSGTRRQAFLWSAAYAVFVASCGALALAARGAGSRSPDRDGENGEGAARPGWRLHLVWLALAACASTLLLAVTNHLTQDVASVPFLWVLPLALYLVSFILCFEGARWYPRAIFLPLAAAGTGGALWLLTGEYGRLHVPGQIAVYGVMLFACCMVCHGELASLKPDPKHLTSFYLMISVGGAAGGLFVGLAAPRLFRTFLELPIGMVAFPILVMTAHYLSAESPFHRSRWGWMWLACAAYTVTVGIVLGFHVNEETQGYRVTARNFYGTLRTADYGSVEDGDYSRKLMHGAINHGEQWLMPGWENQPTSYYGPGSGISMALEECDRNRPQRVGVTGLGAGVILSHARKGDYYRIYEINPLAEQIARTEFTFLKHCPAKVEVIPGDARLSMEREPPQEFDVMLLDAFSGDSVPVHLLTKEAFAVYFRHLKPTGVLVVHISNRFVELSPVVDLLAEFYRKDAILIDDEGDEDNGFFRTRMVLVSGRQNFLARPVFMAKAKPLEKRAGVRLWTDDYSNLLRVLR